MKDTSKAFAISTILCFGLGIGFFLYFHFLEHQARQNLPPDMRTPEAIQNVYDGSVCLGCDISAMILLLLFLGIGTVIAISWGIYEAFSSRQKTVS